MTHYYELFVTIPFDNVLTTNVWPDHVCNENECTSNIMAIERYDWWPAGQWMTNPELWPVTLIQIWKPANQWL